MNYPNVFGNKTWIAVVVLCVGVTISEFRVFAAPQNNDPNAVAKQNDAFYNHGTDYSAPQQEYTLPDWLADFNDPDVGPGVPYTPSNDENSLKVLSWDLVPPKENDPQASTPNFGTIQQNTFPLKFPTNQGFGINLGVQMTTNIPRIITTTSPRPTTTTKKTTARTTTTTTTTTPRPVTTTTEVIHTSNRISAEIFALPGGNSEVLPSWLEGFDDPELSIAVPFEVPEDNKEYNHTLSSDLLPPLEPFEDLKMLSVSGFPPSQVQPVTQTTTTAVPSTTPFSIRTTSVKPPSPTFKPFQFQFVTKAPVNPQITFTQKPFVTASPKITNKPTTNFNVITENPISIRIPQLTLKSSAQPTGFTPSSFVTTQPTAKPTVQPVFDTKFNTFFNSRIGQNGFASFIKTTTTTPTTREFLFGTGTTPSWLTGIGGVNPRPGVPFSLPETRELQQTFNGISPSTNQVAEQTVNGVTIQKSISSELPPLNFIHNSIPSQSNFPTNQAFIFTSTPIPEPSRLFTPPAVVLPDKDENSNIDSILQLQTIPINSNNFAEPTEQTTKPTSKVTFNKSDQGKVISNSVFEPVQLSTKPVFPISQPTPIGVTSSTLVPSFSSQTSTTGSVFAEKYTGGFGGAPGFLGGQNRPGYAVQPDGSIRDPDHTVRPIGQVAAPSLNLQSRIDIPRISNAPTPTTAPGPKRTYTGSFGGPPGVLIPFDNVSGA